MNVVLTTIEQLEEVVQNAVSKVLSSKKEEKPQKIPDSCSLEQALEFLKENGYPVSKSKLYKLTALRKLPVRYFGRRLVFSRSELLKWVDSQLIKTNESTSLLNLAESARKKLNKK